jgi:hypothetical protein
MCKNIQRSLRPGLHASLTQIQPEYSRIKPYFIVVQIIVMRKYMRQNCVVRGQAPVIQQKKTKLMHKRSL